MIPNRIRASLERLDLWITVAHSVRILCALRILRWQLRHFKRRTDQLYAEWCELKADGGRASSGERIQ